MAKARMRPPKTLLQTTQFLFEVRMIGEPRSYHLGDQRKEDMRFQRFEGNVAHFADQ